MAITLGGEVKGYSTSDFAAYFMVGILVNNMTILCGRRWPVRIYPAWLRLGLKFLVPVAFAVTVPAEALTGRLTPAVLLGTVGLTILFLALARFVWRLGVRNYSSASA